MPRGRFLSKDVAMDLELNGVSVLAHLLFLHLIPHLDVDGRMIGEPDQVKTVAVPLRKELDVATLEACLVELHESGLVLWYEVRGHRFLSFSAFEKHQKGIRRDREAPSQVPSPHHPETRQVNLPGTSGTTSPEPPEQPPEQPRSNLKGTSAEPRGPERGGARKDGENRSGVTPGVGPGADPGVDPAQVEVEVKGEVKEGVSTLLPEQPPRTTRETGRQEGVNPEDLERHRVEDRAAIVQHWHLGRSTIQVNGSEITMELEMHIRDRVLIPQYGADAVHGALPLLRQVEELPDDQPASLRLAEQRPEVMQRMIGAWEAEQPVSEYARDVSEGMG